MTLTRSSRATLAVAMCIAIACLVGAQPASAGTCKVPAYPDSKLNGYFTSLKVTNVSCTSGRKLALAYYKCRRARGGVKGNCNGKTVNGLKCTETRDPDNQTETQINAKVTCKSGSKKVVHTYQQDLV